MAKKEIFFFLKKEVNKYILTAILLVLKMLIKHIELIEDIDRLALCFSVCPLHSTFLILLVGYMHSIGNLIRSLHHLLLKLDEPS